MVVSISILAFETFEKASSIAGMVPLMALPAASKKDIDKTPTIRRLDFSTSL